MKISEKVWTETLRLINNNLWRKLFNNTASLKRRETFNSTYVSVESTIKPLFFFVWEKTEDTTCELNKSL